VVMTGRDDYYDCILLFSIVMLLSIVN
jgi:hypothetical protein